MNKPSPKSKEIVGSLPKLHLTSILKSGHKPDFTLTDETESP
jgi:hypothetical protein